MDGVSHISDFDGNRYVRYLNWDGTRWYRDYDWLENDWNGNKPSASLANLFVSSSSIHWLGEVF